LAEQGYEVINSPKVLRGFSPQVCLASVEQAKLMIQKGRITIDKTEVEVRPYLPHNVAGGKQSLNAVGQYVFLGGLIGGTTPNMVKEEVEKLGVDVVTIIKMGSSPQIMLATVEQAQKLVQMKQIIINNTLVDVRPYTDDRGDITETIKNE